MLAIVFSLLIALLQTTQDTTAPPDKPAEKQECQISGQVVSQDGGQPLKNAHVTLRPKDSKGNEKPYSQRTGADGRFCFKGIAAGKYTFGAERRGYVRQMYGAEDTESEGTVLAVEKGQKFEPTLFRLIRAGVITGKIVDEDGEPVAGAMVQALISQEQAAEMLGEPGGKISGVAQDSLLPLQTAVSNDLGEYRLAGLPPGKYFVNVSDTDDKMTGFSLESAISLTPADDNSEEYAPTYYPGTTRQAEAVPVEIKAGDETTANVQLLHEKMVTVSGVVIDEDGKPATQAFVMLMASGNPLSVLSNRSVARVESDGHFSINHVLPGSYVAQASSVNFSENKQVLKAQQQFDVGQQDINNLRLVLGRGVTLTGKLTVEGGTLPKLSEAHFILSSEDGNDGSWIEIQKDGNLKLAGITPGTYTVTTIGFPDQYYLKRVVYGARVSTDGHLMVESGVAPAKLELIMSPNAATIDGIVQNAKLEPVGGATVIVQSARQKKDMETSTAVTDQNGRFEVHGLAPDKYVIIAKKGSKPASQPTSETSVTLAESEKKTITIKIE